MTSRKEDGGGWAFCDKRSQGLWQRSMPEGGGGGSEIVQTCVMSFYE